MPPALFLDRDGTIIEDRGHLRSPSQVAFFPQTIPALRMAQRAFKLFIVTHQPGVAEGVIGTDGVARVHASILARLAQHGIHIERVYYCPHRRSEGCRCIKPNPYHLFEAARQYGIDLRRSFVIGDHPHDVGLAMNAGATGIYVLTGHGEKHRHELPPDTIVASDIWEAAIRATESHTFSEKHAEIAGQISRAAALLKQGGVVVFPTETVYGLGANALDARAVAAIFEIKRRPRFDPLIVHVGSFAQLDAVVAELPTTARDLVESCWPGPLTVVLPKRDLVPDIVTAGLPTVAVRMPDHPMALALIREAGVPIAAPSANLFGRISPTTVQHVQEQLGDRVDMMLDGGSCRVGIESTIISFCGRQPALLRPGGTPIEVVEAVTGPLLRLEPTPAVPLAPGQLPHHYAPKTPLVLRSAAGEMPRGRRVGLLALRAPVAAQGYEVVELLSPTGDLREAAGNLFAALHRLDARGLDLIEAELAPETGLGRAINDRLCRAAGGTPQMTLGNG